MRFVKNKEENLVNANGDVIFIDEKTNNEHYVGRRVLWNLELSKEKYDVYITREVDSDGEYDYTDFEVELRNG